MKKQSKYQERLRQRNIYIHQNKLSSGCRYTNDEGRAIPKPLSVLESMAENKQKAKESIEKGV